MSRSPRRNDFQLSEHFSGLEAECPCCGLIVVRVDLVRILEAIRTMLGSRPLVVTSWCRCAKENARIYARINSRRMSSGLRPIRGFMKSPHIVGRLARGDGGGYAADVKAEIDVDTARLIGEVGARGVGVGDGFCHVDVMPRNGELWRIWTYKGGAPELLIVRKDDGEEVVVSSKGG